MSTTNAMQRLLPGLLAAGLLAAATGCSKNGPPPPPPPGVQRVYETDVDLGKLEQEFGSASPELQTLVKQITIDIKILRLTRAVAMLEKLSGDPSLTESQKKVVGDVSGQLGRINAQLEAGRKK